jgi:inner membrane protein
LNGSSRNGSGNRSAIGDLRCEEGSRHPTAFVSRSLPGDGSDRSRADGRYPIVASEGTDFVLKTPKGLAKTGTQIVPTKVAVEIGEAATVQTQTIVLNDEGVERLEVLAREYPGALVSGELVVDAPELLKLAAVGADQLATIELVGGTVKLKYRTIGQLVADLREQYLTGTLLIRLINQ